MVETRWSMRRLAAVAVSWLTHGPQRHRFSPIPTKHGFDPAFPGTGSLKPPRAKNLMPLSGIGLCEAEITAPISTFARKSIGDARVE